MTNDSKLPMLLKPSAAPSIFPRAASFSSAHRSEFTLTLTESHKFGILFVEEQIDRIDRAVTVLSDDQFGNIFILRFRIIVIFTI